MERLKQTRDRYAEYVRALEALSHAGSDEIDDFGQAYQCAENARLAYELARTALADHCEVHGC